MNDRHSDIIAVSQFMTREHGQGKINLELLLRLCQRGRSVQAVAGWLDRDAEEIDRFDWRRVRVPPKVPSNWLRCELFRRRAQSVVSGQQVSINNGAAVVAPSKINIAMFVHTAWLASKWHPRHGGGAHAKFLAAFNRHQSKLEKLAFAQAETIVALSDPVRQELIEYCGLSPERVITIVPGIDAEQFRPRDSAATNGLRKLCGLSSKDDRMLAAFVGEIRSGRKNLDLLLQTAAQRKDLLVAVLGGTTGSPYPEMASRLGIEDRVFFLGHRTDVPELLPGADVFVFPTHYEPFGLVVTEAMACGLPVVVTRQAGSAGVVEHGVSGWLLEDGGDAAGLSDALGTLAEPAIRNAWGTAARNKAETLTWDRMTDQYESYL